MEARPVYISIVYISINIPSFPESSLLLLQIKGSFLRAAPHICARLSSRESQTWKGRGMVEVHNPARFPGV